MMSGWRGIFGKRRKAGAVASLRSKVEQFQSLLARNNLVLELMAEAGESLGGDLLFDSQYLRHLAEQLEESVQRVVLDLNRITENRYPDLAEAFERIREEVAATLQSRPPVSGGPYILWMDEIDRDLSGAVGDKMARLGEIRKRWGFRAPDGFVITSAACHRVFEKIGLADRLAVLRRSGGPGALDAAAVQSRMGELIERARIPRDVARAIRKAAARAARQCKAPALFAVRSSAIGEDGDLSFAGLHATCLGAPASEVLNAYKRVLASLFSAPAIVYRAERDEPPEHALMAVGCMPMIRAVSSGVAYTLDPVDPDRDVLVVSAAPGLGRTVVEGGGPVDRFVVSRRPPHEVLSRRTPDKTVMTELDATRGVRTVPAPPERRQGACVPDEFLAKLAEAALKVERYMDGAQDIEWARDEEGELVLLQARPLRLLAATAGVATRAQTAARRRRVLLEGQGTIACRGIGHGRVVMMKGGEIPAHPPEDCVLVARFASPQLAQLVPRANAVLTDVGASTGHLATITREFRVPAIVDVGVATTRLVEGQEVTVDAEENAVYEGRVDELLRYHAMKQSSFEDTREYRMLRRMLKQITPLNLTDPQAARFSARRCRTYHDIIRFAHEKAVDYFLEGREADAASGDPHCKTVDLSIPLDLMVIDLGGGVDPAARGPRCSPEQIECLPLRALLDGLNAPGAWSTEPTDMDLGSFLSSAIGPSPLSASHPRGARRNLAVASHRYLNLNLHLGYHFNQVDSYVSETRNDNYLYFRFAGGLTDAARRARRAKMISIILEKQDFAVDMEGDFVVARLKKFERETMLQRLRMLGLLIGFTRQMDVRMRSDSMIADGVDEFMRTLYSHG